jgi:hypothetical protein
VLICLIVNPPLELADADFGATGQIEQHRSPDLVRLQLLGQLGVLSAQGVTGDERRARRDLEDDG